MSEALAKKIKEKIYQQRLTVASLEREAGLKVHAVRNILLGKSKNPSAETIRAISKVLECSVDELLSTDDQTVSKDSNTLNDSIEIKDLILLENSTKEAISLFKEHYKTPLYKEISFLSLEIYLYSLENNAGILDNKFAKWLYTKNFS